jgi:hypothetical protein
LARRKKVLFICFMILISRTMLTLGRIWGRWLKAQDQGLTLILCNPTKMLRSSLHNSASLRYSHIFLIYNRVEEWTSRWEKDGILQDQICTNLIWLIKRICNGRLISICSHKLADTLIPDFVRNKI